MAFYAMLKHLNKSATIVIKRYYVAMQNKVQSHLEKIFIGTANFNSQYGLVKNVENIDLLLDQIYRSGIKRLDMFQGRDKMFIANGEDFTRDLKTLSFLSSSISCGIRYKL